jgi:perosamine synthetase
MPAPGRSLVPHSRPCLGKDEEEAALRVLRSGRLAPGTEAARCETLLARVADCADGVVLSSGTMALTLALRALGLGPHDKVAIPTYCCAALLHAVRAAGTTPLLCDIDPDTLALDPEEPARRAGPSGARAAIVVHPFGRPADLEPLRARGLLLIEDCAQALGGSDRGRPLGSRGDVAVFSFGPTKVITGGGPGGGLTSPQAALVRAARDLAGYDEKDQDRPRLNGLLGDLHAAIAAVQIGRLREFIERRAAIAALYDQAFAGLPFERLPAREGARPVVYRYLLRLRQGAERFRERLNERGIMARRPVHLPLHRLVGSAEPFPHSDGAHQQMISLPLYPAMRESEVERVIEEVKRCRP